MSHSSNDNILAPTGERHYSTSLEPRLQRRGPVRATAMAWFWVGALTIMGCGSSQETATPGSAGAPGAAVSPSGAGTAAGVDAAGVIVIRRADIMANGGPVWTLASDQFSRTNLVKMSGPLPRHFHPDARHSLIVIEGTVVAKPGEQSETLVSGDYISIPAGMPHSYDAPNGPALLVSFDAPAYDPAKTVQVASDDNMLRPPASSEDNPEVVVVHRADVTQAGGPVWTLHQDSLSRSNLVKFSGITPRHYHPDARHSILVVEGQVIALVGDDELTLGPGDYLSIPALLPHNYRVDQGEAWAVSIDAPFYDPAKTVQVP